MIVFDAATSDPRCPAGRGLLVPVDYTTTGTIADWGVSSAQSGIAPVATATTLDGISSVSMSDAAVQWQATVDPALEDLARATLPSTADPSCDLNFSLGPEPEDLLAGAWAEELAECWLAVACGGEQYSTLLSWTPESVSSLTQ